MAQLSPEQYAEMRTELASLKASIEQKKDPLVWPFRDTAKLEKKYHELDGNFDKKKQRVWRRHIHHLVTKTGQQLGLPQWSIGNALMLCHKYYTSMGMTKNDRFTIAAACLHLAAKFDNSPKPIDKLVPACLRYMRGWNDADLQTPAAQSEIEYFKHEVLAAERSVLYALDFNLHTPLIYVFLVQLISKLAEKDHQFHALMQHTWNFINDSFCSTLCLQYPSDKIVGAALYISNLVNIHKHGQQGDIMPLMTQIMGQPQGDFFSVFNMTLEELKDISHQILTCYREVKGVYADLPDDDDLAAVRTAAAAGDGAHLPGATPRTAATTANTAPSAQQQQQQQQQPQQQGEEEGKVEVGGKRSRPGGAPEVRQQPPQPQHKAARKGPLD